MLSPLALHSKKNSRTVFYRSHMSDRAMQFIRQVTVSNFCSPQFITTHVGPTPHDTHSTSAQGLEGWNFCSYFLRTRTQTYSCVFLSYTKMSDIVTWVYTDAHTHTVLFFKSYSGRLCSTV
jgi:hypothetical protein